LLFIVALRGIPTRGQGVRHVGIFIRTILASLFFSEIDLELMLGPHEKVDGICGIVMGFHTQKRRIKCYNEFLSLGRDPKLTHWTCI
jgi:hypothetical protein